MKKIFSLILFFSTAVVWACPNCHTAVEKANKPPYTLIILGIFILSIYIPMYILFNASRKYDPSKLDADE
jgi:hypothetical protein